MKDPVKIGDNAWFDKSEIAAVIRQGGKVLAFLKSGKPVSIDDRFSTEEIESLIKSTE